MALLQRGSHFKEKLFLVSIWPLKASLDYCIVSDLLQRHSAGFAAPATLFKRELSSGSDSVSRRGCGEAYLYSAWLERRGKKALFVYIWFSGAACKPLAGCGDVMGSAESVNGSSPLLGADGCSLGNYAHSVHGCFPPVRARASGLGQPDELLVFYFKQVWIFPRSSSSDRSVPHDYFVTAGTSGRAFPILLLLRRHRWQPCLIITTVVRERPRPLVESSRRPPPSPPLPWAAHML